jgi:hypothetical protein
MLKIRSAIVSGSAPRMFDGADLLNASPVERIFNATKKLSGSVHSVVKNGD